MRIPRDPAGHVLHGKYELLEELGRGGMGVVYRARSVPLEREVAIKLIARDAGEDELERLLVEARALARVQHRGVMQVHDLGRLDGSAYLVMDLVPGGESLADRLARDGPLPPARAAELVARIARALGEVHEQGVIHRDLKPDNVLMRGEEPVLTDFGLARLRDQHLTRTGEILGTPAYMAPEQVDGLAPDERTDVYGLGALLFALLTGRPPFRGRDVFVTLRSVLEQPPPRPSELDARIDAAIDEVCLRCLAKERDERFASAREVAAALDRARSPGRVGSLEPARRRERPAWLGTAVLFAGAAVAAVLAGAAAGVFRLGAERARDPVVAPAPVETGPSAEDRRRADELITLGWRLACDLDWRGSADAFARAEELAGETTRLLALRAEARYRQSIYHGGAGSSSFDAGYELALAREDFAALAAPTRARVHAHVASARYPEDPGDAERRFGEAIALAPDDAWIRLLRGEARIARWSVERARLAAAVKPDLPELPEELERLEADGLADYDRAVELDPSLGYALSKRGLARLGRGFPGAMAELDRAVRVDPLLPDVWYGRAYSRHVNARWIHQMIKKPEDFPRFEDVGRSYEAALADYERALGLCATPPPSWRVALAEVCYGLGLHRIRFGGDWVGMLERAGREIEEALADWPSIDPQERQRLEQVRAACAARLRAR